MRPQANSEDEVSRSHSKLQLLQLQEPLPSPHNWLGSTLYPIPHFTLIKEFIHHHHHHSPEVVIFFADQLHLVFAIPLEALPCEEPSTSSGPVNSRISATTWKTNEEHDATSLSVITKTFLPQGCCSDIPWMNSLGGWRWKFHLHRDPSSLTSILLVPLVC